MHSARGQSGTVCVMGGIRSENVLGISKGRGKAFIEKIKNIYCMKESNFYNRVNPKSMLGITKGKIWAWALTGKYIREDAL